MFGKVLEISSLVLLKILLLDRFCLMEKSGKKFLHNAYKTDIINFPILKGYLWINKTSRQYNRSIKSILQQNGKDKNLYFDRIEFIAYSSNIGIDSCCVTVTKELNFSVTVYFKAFKCSNFWSQLKILDGVLNRKENEKLVANCWKISRVSFLTNSDIKYLKKAKINESTCGATRRHAKSLGCRKTRFTLISRQPVCSGTISLSVKVLKSPTCQKLLPLIKKGPKIIVASNPFTIL